MSCMLQRHNHWALCPQGALPTQSQVGWGSWLIPVSDPVPSILYYISESSRTIAFCDKMLIIFFTPWQKVAQSILDSKSRWRKLSVGRSDRLHLEERDCQGGRCICRWWNRPGSFQKFCHDSGDNVTFRIGTANRSFMSMVMLRRLPAYMNHYVS